MRALKAFQTAMTLAQTPSVIMAPFFLLFALQTAKSPDMSMLDAGLFPWMERQQQASGATTTDEIRGSVMGVWRALKPEMLGRIGDRMQRK